MCWGRGISPLAPLVYTGAMETAACVERCFWVSAGNCERCGERGQGEQTTAGTWGTAQPQPRYGVPKALCGEGTILGTELLHSPTACHCSFCAAFSSLEATLFNWQKLTAQCFAGRGCIIFKSELGRGTTLLSKKLERSLLLYLHSFKLPCPPERWADVEQMLSQGFWYLLCFLPSLLLLSPPHPL